MFFGWRAVKDVRNRLERREPLVRVAVPRLSDALSSILPLFPRVQEPAAICPSGFPSSGRFSLKNE